MSGRAITPCIHYVGFTGDEYLRARRIFGGPAFIHPGWDLRAAREIAECDTVVFAKGAHDQIPRVKSYHDWMD